MISSIILGAILPFLSMGTCSEPRVVRAVAPFYTVVPAANGFQGEVAVEVDIAPNGKVQEASTIRGNRMLAVEALRAARRWQFESCATEETRKVSLNFRFILLLDDSKGAETAPIFMPPYAVEVRTIRPKLEHTRAITKKSN